MAQSGLPGRVVRQPRGSLELARGSGIVDGIYQAYDLRELSTCTDTAGGQIRDLASGKIDISYRSVPSNVFYSRIPVNDVDGMSMTMTGSAGGMYGVYDAGRSSAIKSGDLTALLVHSRNSGYNYVPRFLCRAQYWSYWPSVSSIFHGGTNGWVMGYDSGVGIETFYGPAYTIHSTLAVRRGSTVSAYQSGRQILAPVSHTYNTDTWHDTWCIGSAENWYGCFVGGTYALLVVWQRALNDAEAIDITRNPWQLFKDTRSRRIFILGNTESAVYSDLAATYSTVAAVGASYSPQYDVFKYVSADLSPQYSLLPEQQLVYPISDVSNSGWVPSTGPDLFAMVDEVDFNDADYIYTQGMADTFEVLLGDMNTPEAGDVALNVRIPPAFPLVVDLTIRLKEGTTTIAEWQIDAAESGTVNLPLTTMQRDSISNWGNLRVWGST